MRTTQLLLATLKQTPSDAVIISHQLMLRAGMIRKVASGLYTWLPLGLRVLRNVEQIVRKEMERAGALEMLMPAVQPAELWRDSGRWEQYGPELLRFRDRHERDFCFGPTHEEVITEIARTEIKTYKQLPLNFYQIQTKFRDEIRPRFGIMRAREFLMKDAYSFHASQDCLQITYKTMYEAYQRIFSQLGLRYCAVEAQSGQIGGSHSHEFHVLAESGEDAIVFSDTGDYAANLEKATSYPPPNPKPVALLSMHKVATRGSFQQHISALKVPTEQTVKTLLVAATARTPEAPNLVALVIRGDHSLNEAKVEQLEAVATPLSYAPTPQVEKILGCEPDSVGPVGLKEKGIVVIVDESAAQLNNFVAGANKNGSHLKNVNWQRDAEYDIKTDIRNVVPGDISPSGKGNLLIKRGIEVGHIFQLGNKYSKAMDAQVLDEKGKRTPLIMGCYGIGVSRIVAAAIEQNHDECGIIWTDALAPFQFVIIPLNLEKSPGVATQTLALYKTLTELGYEVLLDDRKASPGIKMKDMDLIGIPHRLLISERGLAAGIIEYKNRKAPDIERIPAQEVMDFIINKLSVPKPRSRE